MSDREIYCDRDYYDRDSQDILGWLSKDSIKTDIELEYFEYYRKLTSKLSNSKFLIRHYKDILKKGTLLNMPEYYHQKINVELSNVEIYKKLLSKLELTTPIENILQRERKPNEIITLYFLNRELPNIPYNVYASRSNFLLSKEEIMFIKTILEEKTGNSKFKEYVNHLKVNQEENNRNKKLQESNKQKSIKEILRTPKTYIIFIVMFLVAMFYIYFTNEILYSCEEEKLAFLLSTIPILFALSFYFIFRKQKDRLKTSIVIVTPFSLSLLIMFISGLDIDSGFEILGILISAFVMFYNLIIL